MIIYVCESYDTLTRKFEAVITSFESEDKAIEYCAIMGSVRQTVLYSYKPYRLNKH